MNILFVTWYFPPFNDVAALRTGAMSEFLAKRRHNVFVVTAARHAADQSLPVPTGSIRIVRTPWFDIDRLRIQSGDMPSSELVTGRQKPRRSRLSLETKARTAAAQLYTNLVHIPDRQMGWLRYAIKAGRELAQSNVIDLIYASGPPFTTHVTAKTISCRFGVPWIAEYRDGWSGDFYSPRPKWRQAIDRRFEASTIHTASGIVAATDPWASYYRSRFGKPTIAIYNGYDESDVILSERQTNRDEPVTITYLGILYDGLRNPSPLYEAICRSKLSPAELKVVYHGPAEAEVKSVANKFGVDRFVDVRPRISHGEALRIQRASDVLLLLQSPNDPRNVPAKLFEYISSQRPILGVGLDNGVPAALIRERNAGIYSSDPNIIARQLDRWVREKQDTGLVADIPVSARAGLSRSEQFVKLEKFLYDVLARKIIKPLVS